MDKNDFLITTTDNPWNPFTNFDEWNSFDTEYGYCTWQRIDRLMPVDYLRMSESEINQLINKVMDRLVELLPNTYMKVFNSDEETKESKNKYKNLAALTVAELIQKL